MVYHQLSNFSINPCFFCIIVQRLLNIYNCVGKLAVRAHIIFFVCKFAAIVINVQRIVIFWAKHDLFKRVVIIKNYSKSVSWINIVESLSSLVRAHQLSQQVARKARTKKEFIKSITPRYFEAKVVFASCYRRRTEH